MKLSRCFAADFETTTDENDCRVWAYAVCNVEDYTDFRYGNSIDEFFDFCSNSKENYRLWFHNLKFDGIYIIHYLLSHGFEHISDIKDKRDKTFTTLIVDSGQFYAIKVYFKVQGHHTNKVEIYDSLKIFPNFSVEKVAEGFNLPIRKLKIDYRAYRELGHQLTKKEIDYIRNDVEIMARALREMFIRKLTKMTIASDAMGNFREHFVGFRKKFPVLPSEVDKDIRKAYRGGFTYLNPNWQERPAGKGIILDINSLYPFCMSSPNFLPYGQPQFFEGEYKPDKTYPLYIQAFCCSFDIKPHKIPSVQLKNTMGFIPNEYVRTTHGERVTLYFTNIDFKLFKEQYNVYDIEYFGGWKFKQASGYFDDYINYWTEQKIQAGKEGNAPQRQIAKLMLNSLYGRFGISGKSRRKEPYLEDGIVKFKIVEDEPRETCYLPVACFVTSIGRNRIIRASQAIADYTREKYGEDRWKYGDTDSCHCDLTPEDLEALKDIIQIDDYKLGYFKQEGVYTESYYVRQKCYCERLDNGELNVVVAGLPKYLAPLVTFDNFKRGFTTAGMDIETMIGLARKNGASEDKIEKIQHKLTYKYVKGGVILADTDFTIK